MLLYDFADDSKTTHDGGILLVQDDMTSDGDDEMQNDLVVVKDASESDTGKMHVQL